MSELLRLDDDALVERLRAVASRADPVPTSVLDAGHRAFRTTLADETFAALIFDSADDDALAGVRGAATRQLTFAIGDLTIDVDLDHDAIVGQIIGGSATTVELQTPTDDIPLELDDLGRFFGEVPANAALRLRISRPLGDPVVTEWVRR